MKKFWRKPLTSGVLFVLALVMLLSGSIGTTRAALRYSGSLSAGVTLNNIGLLLCENGEVVSGSGGSGALLTTLIPAGETLKIGKRYDERLTAVNNGNINEYVRVNLFRYFTDAQGNKLCELDPSLIQVELGKGWHELENERTEERLVLVYDGILNTGAESTPFVTGLTVSGDVFRTVREGDGGWSFSYDGINVCMKAEVNAVQDHHATDAMTSAWGYAIG